MRKNKAMSDKERIAVFWESGDDVLFDTKTTSLILNLMPKTLWHRRKSGDFIGYIKTSQKILYRKKDICAYLDSHKVNS